MQRDRTPVGTAARPRRRPSRGTYLRRRLAALLVLGTALTGIGMLAGIWSSPFAETDVQVPLPVEELSARELAGQRAILSYEGTEPPRSVLRMIRRGEAAGIIFFAPNIESPGRLRAIAGRLQRARAQARSPLLSQAPLLLLVDQEGGEVRRLPGEPRSSQLAIARSADPDRRAAEAGSQAAANLAGAGLNVNLAPVLDVEREPVGEGALGHEGRTYGSSPADVGRLGGRFIAVQQAGGVAATAKHFPGLGAAAAEQHTDERPVTLDSTLQELREIDIAPYAVAIESDVKLVMTSHAIYPALDPAQPATFSRAILQGELRERLGYNGVIVTDALEAPALDPFGDVAHRARLAAAAGADLLLFSSQDAEQGAAGHAALVEALETGALERAPFERSAERVLRLRLELGGQPEPDGSPR